MVPTPYESLASLTVSVDKMNSDFMTFDSSTLTLYVDYSKVKSSDVGDH